MKKIQQFVICGHLAIIFPILRGTFFYLPTIKTSDSISKPSHEARAFHLSRRIHYAPMCPFTGKPTLRRW